MYKYLKCEKGFKFESDYNRHINRKTNCNKKKDYTCDLCKLQFKCPYDQKRHENTEKHINKFNKITNNEKILNLDNNELEIERLQIAIENYKLETEQLKKEHKLVIK